MLPMLCGYLKKQKLVWFPQIGSVVILCGCLKKQKLVWFLLIGSVVILYGCLKKQTLAWFLQIGSGELIRHVSGTVRDILDNSDEVRDVRY
jgi:hypothetical protein